MASQPQALNPRLTCIIIVVLQVKFSCCIYPKKNGKSNTTCFFYVRFQDINIMSVTPLHQMILLKYFCLGMIESNGVGNQNLIKIYGASSVDNNPLQEREWKYLSSL